jgi:hypothetical protein
MPIDIPRQTLPAAQESKDPKAAAGETPPPAASPETPPAAGDDDAKRERDRRAAEGRRLRALEETNVQLAQNVSVLTSRLEQMGAQLSAREQRDQEAYLNSLPPDERLEKKVELLEQRLAAPPARPTQPAAPPTEDPVAYQRRRAQEILDGINERFGTDITPEEAVELGRRGIVDWASEDTYVATLRSVAIQAAQARPTPSQGGVTPQGKETPVAKNSQTDDIDKRIQDGVDAALRDLGIHRPNSPRAAAASGPVSSEDMQKTTWGYSSRQGPKAMRAKLQQQIDAAREAAPKS